MYVGQAIDLERRIKQHLTDKDWWTQVVLMTTKDDSINSSDIDYLEARLISLAIDAGTSDGDNKKKGNRQKVDEFRQAELEQYLDEALFLLELIGVRVFKRPSRKNVRSVGQPILSNPSAPISETTKDQFTKPALPDNSLGPCAYAKEALTNLLQSGYMFSDEQIEAFSSVEGSKLYTKRSLPLFWRLKEGESRSTCDKKVKSRYWKDEFKSGTYRFLM